jgi:hypothetical protein
VFVILMALGIRILPMVVFHSSVFVPVGKISVSQMILGVFLN